MANFNFEENRQLWETGPHWELKREFLERYKNDFPEDTLLCLAQVYSNIELMNCRYPDPVMLQVHELSKPLTGCRRFREANRKLEEERKATKKKGKRSLTDEESQKTYKFIKFCSAASSAEKTPEKKTTNVSPASIIPSANFDRIPFVNSCTDEKYLEKSGNTLDITSFVDNLEQSDNKIPKNSDITEAESLTDLNVNNMDHDSIFFISKSPDLKLIERIADGLKNLPKKRFPIVDIQNVVSNLGLVNFVNFKIISVEKACICKFYIGNTLISVGKDSNERNARKKAAEYGLQILNNISNLPCTSLNILKNHWLQGESKVSTHLNEFNTEKEPISMIDVTEQKDSMLVQSDATSALNEDKSNITGLNFWLSFAEEVKIYTGKNLLAVDIIQNAAKKFNSNIFYFSFSEDLNASLNNHIFYCDLVIDKVLICQGKGSRKKNARNDAAEKGVLCLINLADWHNESNILLSKTEDMINTKKKPLESSFVQTQNIENFIPFQKENDILPQNKNESINKLPASNSACCSKVSSNTISKAKNKKQKKAAQRAARKAHSELTRPNVINKYKHSLQGKASETVTSHHYISSPGYQEELMENETTQLQPFILNKTLLNNSYVKQLAVLDHTIIKQNPSPSSILNSSASFCRKQMNYKVEEILPSFGNPKIFRFHVLFDGEVIGTGEADSRAEARVIATQSALEYLKKIVYTIKVKNECEDGFVISRNQVMSVSAPSTVVSDNNIGCKMLKTMGWCGGGIGKTSGIIEPIVASEPRFKEGLGFSVKGKAKIMNKEFKRNIEALLKDFCQSNSINDLIFSTDFSKEERTEIHKIAGRYNLCSKSFKRNDQRQLHLKRKIDVVELLNNLVAAGGSTTKYELIDGSVQNM